MMLHRIIGILLIAFSFALAWVMMDFNQFKNKPLSLPPEAVLYSLASGTSVAGLAADLEQRGYLEMPLYLRLLARWEGLAHKLKAGEYLLQPGTTPVALLEQLVAGKVTTYSLTLVEGWNFRQVVNAIAQQDALQHTLTDLSVPEIMERLGHAGEHPEGRFLPDTYHFPKGSTDVDLLRRAYDAMQRQLASEWAARAQELPLKTPYEALILASIIEKETGLAEERSRIAGVFIRRLNKGMLLQTDPTVIYGMGEAFDGNIRRRDLRRDTPYNTYLHKGLPPTPIAMPGIDAIRAALHPAAGKSLYFVARGDGGHHFSNTLKEHNKAVRRYQLKQKKQ